MSTKHDQNEPQRLAVDPRENYVHVSDVKRAARAAIVRMNAERKRLRRGGVEAVFNRVHHAIQRELNRAHCAYGRAAR